MYAPDWSSHSPPQPKAKTSCSILQFIYFYINFYGTTWYVCLPDLQSNPFVTHSHTHNGRSDSREMNFWSIHFDIDFDMFFGACVHVHAHSHTHIHAVSQFMSVIKIACLCLRWANWRSYKDLQFNGTADNHAQWDSRQIGGWVDGHPCQKKDWFTYGWKEDIKTIVVTDSRYRHRCRHLAYGNQKWL